MEARYATRKQQWLAEGQVTPAIFDPVRPRLATLMAPCVETCCRQAPDPQAQTSVGGLLSDVAPKHVASSASRCGQDRLPRQRFIGWAPWEDVPLRQEVTRHVTAPWGHVDGVLVCDPAGCPTSGPESVGVARQWCGRLGTVDNGQVAVYVGDVSGEGYPLVDRRLYRPTAWTPDQARLDQAGVPNDHRGYRSRHPWAWDRLQASGTRLPPGWMAGDDARGRPLWCRHRRARLGERSMLAVPGNTLLRDLATAPPEDRGRGRRPKRPWQRLDQWSTALAQDAWTSIDVRDGAKGPLLVAMVTGPVVARTPPRQAGHQARAVVVRSRDRDQPEVVQVDYDLSKSAVETALAAFARVAKAAHRLDACRQRGKSEAGLADDEGRKWTGWHHHQPLSLIATWFFVTETPRGKNMDPGDDVTSDSRRHRVDLAPSVSVRDAVASAA